MSDDFQKALERSFQRLDVRFKAGDKVSGKVVAVDSKSVFVDVNAKSEAIIDVGELLGADGLVSVKEGDVIEAFVSQARDDDLRLTMRMSGKAAAGHLDEACASGIPVDGKVTGVNKGGYTVKLAGKDAFCPFSQMDLRSAQDPESHVGKTYTFQVTRVSGNDITVGRRRLMEQEKAKRLSLLKETLAEGDTVEGVVVAIKEFGAFVDLDGTDGFIPASEFSWGKNASPNDFVALGQHVKVVVKKLDWDAQRITLSFKSAATPFESLAEKYPPGTVVEGVVRRLAPFGAFIEIEKGVEGLAHISKISPGRRIRHPSEVVKEGDKVTVAVEKVDAESERISLTFDTNWKPLSDIEQSEADATEYESVEPVRPAAQGDLLEGTVENVRDFGAFIKLPSGQTGLLRVGERNPATGVPLNLPELKSMFQVGAKVKVLVSRIESGKISLSIPKQELIDAAVQVRSKPGPAAPMGSLADAFGKIGL